MYSASEPEGVRNTPVPSGRPQTLKSLSRVDSSDCSKVTSPEIIFSKTYFAADYPSSVGELQVQDPLK